MWLESPITFLHCVHEARMKKIVHLPPPSEKQIYIVQVIMMMMMMMIMMMIVHLPPPSEKQIYVFQVSSLADSFCIFVGRNSSILDHIDSLDSYHNQALWGLRLSFILK